MIDQNTLITKQVQSLIDIGGGDVKRLIAEKPIKDLGTEIIREELSAFARNLLKNFDIFKEAFDPESNVFHLLYYGREDAISSLRECREIYHDIPLKNINGHSRLYLVQDLDNALPTLERFSKNWKDQTAIEIAMSFYQGITLQMYFMSSFTELKVGFENILVRRAELNPNGRLKEIAYFIMENESFWMDYFPFTIRNYLMILTTALLEHIEQHYAGRIEHARMTWRKALNQ